MTSPLFVQDASNESPESDLSLEFRHLHQDPKQTVVGGESSMRTVMTVLDDDSCSLTDERSYAEEQRDRAASSSVCSDFTSSSAGPSAADIAGEVRTSSSIDETKEAPMGATPIVDTVTRNFPLPSASIYSLPASILKVKLTDANYIYSRPRRWSTLPCPDMNKILSESNNTTNTTISSTSSLGDNLESQHQSLLCTKCKKAVQFTTVTIRDYGQTIGDNPSCPYGVPVQLDWCFEEREALDINDYEGSGRSRRGMRQLVLTHFQRKKILMFRYNFSEEELRKVKKEISKLRNQRLMTKQLIPMMKVEDILESTQRKMKRVLKL